MSPSVSPEGEMYELTKSGQVSGLSLSPEHGQHADDDLT